MDNFFDLQNSQFKADQLKFQIFTEILSHLFGVDQIEKDKVYRYSTKLETEENHKYLRDNWDLMDLFDCRTEYHKKIKSLSLQMIKAISNYLNQKYQFTHPITIKHVRFNQRSDDGQRVITHTSNDVRLN